MKRVRTRFAPSPTGFLHIGGLRTALFSYLFAQHNDGDFILRIEDTDQVRLVEGALEDIAESLEWIGIEWDEGPGASGTYGPYRQSERRDIYISHAHRLIKKGDAYKCYCSPERLKVLREEQKARGAPTGYDRRCRNLSEEQIQKHEENQDRFVIRLKTPLFGQTTLNDEIRGTLTTPNETLDDIVLLKSDGYPTYHLAHVVDDHLMDITHVIRGEEWIPSAPRHILLYKAFEWTLPVFAHVPVILAPDGGKLSKRHGATMVKEFRAKGYLKEAVLNFIALLGWSLDDKTEFFDMDSLIEQFDLKRVSKAPAVFSYEKLDWFNGVYIRKQDKNSLYNLLLPFLMEKKLVSPENEAQRRDYILEIIPLIQERLKSLSEIADIIWFFFDDHFEIRDKNSLLPKKLSREDTLSMLERTIAIIEEQESFEEEELEKALRNLVEKLGLKTAQVFMPLRVAITGTKVSPGLFETMRVLGKERVLKRLQHAAETVKTMV